MALIPIKNKFNLFWQIKYLIFKLKIGNKKLDETIDDNFNFTSTLSLDSPNGQIEKIQKKNENDVYHFSIYQNGLTGATGAMPTIYTEWLIERETRYNDFAPKALLDIFNHRQYCLSYLAWHKQHYPSKVEGHDNNTISNVVLSLCGMSHISDKLSNNGHAQFYTYSVRSLTNLERILRQICQAQVIIIPFSGRWQNVDHNERCQLGDKKILLSYGPVIGNVRWDISSSFEVIIGPVDLNIAHKFMSQGEYYDFIQEQIRIYVGVVLDFIIKVKIHMAPHKSIPLGKGELGKDTSIGKQHEPSIYTVRVY